MVRISRNKTEYMECNFREKRSTNSDEVNIQNHKIPKSGHLHYLGLIINKDGEIANDGVQ